MNRKPHLRVFLLTIVTVAAAYLLMELFAFGFYWLVNGKSFPFSEFQRKRYRITESSQPDRIESGGEINFGGNVFEVIHPYLGFVRDPDKMKTHCRHGFFGPDPLTCPESDRDLIVAIFGGSFAEAVAREAGSTLARKLQESNQFRNRNIRVLTLALGGYKQPQQLLTLTYFLALGADFDIVINIDGFNEMVLPLQENLPKNVFLPYPRSWYMRVAAVEDDEILLRLGRKATLKEDREHQARLFSRIPFRYSVISNLIWEVLDRRLRRRIYENDLSLQKYRLPGDSKDRYVATGPELSFPQRNQLYSYLAGIWENCSRQMDRLCRANRIEYYHFLQPNQYLPGSKIMGEEERRIAYKSNHPYREDVVRGYPLMIKAGSRLEAEEINFKDLTMIFKDSAEILYADSACHLNREGYRQIAAAIAEFIISRSKKQIQSKRQPPK